MPLFTPGPFCSENDYDIEDLNDNECRIIKYHGKETEHSIQIPDTISRKTVTEIGECAFSGCTGLTEINIPNGVTRIWYHAFWRCTGLKEATIPQTINSFVGILLDGCDSLERINYGGTIENAKRVFGTQHLCSLSNNQLFSSLSNNVTIYCTDGEYIL